MSLIRHTDTPLSEESRDRLYTGCCFLGSSKSLRALVAHSQHMVSNGFYDVAIERAHEALTVDVFRDRVIALRRAFNEDTAVRSLTGKLISEFGGKTEDAYFDVLRLRIAPPERDGLSHPFAALPVHRDTWGSNLMQQLNIWAPIMDLSAQSTLAYWPEAFAASISNDSKDWDIDELRRKRETGSTASYPLLPSATESRSLDTAELAMPEVGEAFVFSGAHLHASVPNATDRSRLNFELRVVFHTDRLRGAGAPNVDGAAPRTPMHWFKRLSDGAQLPSDGSPLMLA